MRRILFGVLLGLFWIGAVRGGSVPEQLLIDDFEQGLRPVWREQIFQGQTRYRVVAADGGKVLQADSRGTASGLVFKQRYDLQQYPCLAWRWQVSNILTKGDARSRAGDDYAARVYVVFPHWFPSKTRSINYIWANRLPRGEFLANPFYGNAVMLAVESGTEKVGSWVEEKRNVLADYRMIFGEEPPLAGAIAIMTDTDNTGESASAWYDDIRLESASP
ncbi:MAG: DUF3047 domain-containing protein [Desulfuromonadaceae bacterium]|jgi:hypothetical protein